MNATQRKWHTLIWTIILIGLPIFIFFAVKDLDFTSSENTPLIERNSNLGIPVKAYENDFVKVSIFKDSVELILKQSLKNPSAIVYETNSEGAKINALGQLTNIGIYTFKIQNLPSGILIYDSIKETEIIKILF